MRRKRKGSRGRKDRKVFVWRREGREWREEKQKGRQGKESREVFMWRREGRRRLLAWKEGVKKIEDKWRERRDSERERGTSGKVS